MVQFHVFRIDSPTNRKKAMTEEIRKLANFVEPDMRWCKTFQLPYGSANGTNLPT